MRRVSVWPGKKTLSRKKFYDAFAKPLFIKNGDTGCVMFHGFSGTPANIYPVTRAVADAGFSVYAPLLSGHGESIKELERQNWQIWRDEAYEAYSRLKDVGCTKVVMAGLSLGALLACIVAANQDVDGLILISAPFKMKKYLLKAAKFSTLMPYAIAEDFHPKYQRESLYQGYRGTPVKKLRDIEALSIIARGALVKINCPTLLIQPVKDKRVDLTSVAIVERAIINSELTKVMLKNSPHMATLGPEMDFVAESCVNFLTKIDGAE